MRFTIEEIKNFLFTQPIKMSVSDIEILMDNLTEENIIKANPVDTEVTFERTEKNLEVYETQIGMTDLKKEQSSLFYKTNGTKGKYWLALSPRWITNTDSKLAQKTKYEIWYWVNYGDDETYGGFTVEEIKQWLTTPELKLYTISGTRERVKNER